MSSSARSGLALVVGLPLVVGVGVGVGVTTLSAGPARADAFGGDNGRIAFARAPDQFTTGFDIFTMEPDGSDVVQLTSGPSFEHSPAWSPDGSRLVFVRRTAPGVAAIWSMNADGSAQTMLFDAAFSSSPTWSPDGARIAFESVRDDPHGDLFVMAADGTAVTNLTSSVGVAEISPSFSPDGGRIAYLAPVPATNRYDLHVMNADGTGGTNITNLPVSEPGSHSSPSWSPDGSRLIFGSFRTGDAPGSHLYTIASDGTGLTRLTNAPLVDDKPSFSPDGSRVVFQRRDPDFEIMVMDADGTNLTNITNASPDHDVTAAWQAVPSADLALTKTTLQSEVLAGGAVTYSLTVTNHGPSASPGTSIQDPVPPGLTVTGLDPGCTVHAGTVRCSIGFLPVGSSATRQVTMTVSSSYVASTGLATDHDHQWTLNKVERHVSVGPGQTRSAIVQCASNEVLSDGSYRIDHVDVGAPEDVVVLEAQSNGARDFVVTVTNPTLGDAQVKVFGVCLVQATSSNDAHEHSITTSGPADTAVPVGVGTRVVTATCGPGRIAVAPGFRLFSAEARLVGSAPASAGNAWDFTFEVAAAGTLRASVWCLPLRTSTTAGHSHALVVGQRERTVTVPGSATVSESVSCPDDAKGMVASWHAGPAMSLLGNDPQPKSRVFRLHNLSASATSARIGLICLADRTGRGGDASVVNTACVSGVYQDPDFSDDCDDVAVAVVPQPHGLVAIGDAVTVLNPGASGSPRSGLTRLRVPMSCRGPGRCDGRLRVEAWVKGRSAVIARGRFALAPATSHTSTMLLTSTGSRSFATWSDNARVRVVAVASGAGAIVTRRPRLE